MACYITIDRLSVLGRRPAPGQPPNTISFEGSSDGCRRLAVRVLQNGHAATKLLDVQPGPWSVALRAPEDFDAGDFVCGNVDLEIIARCDLAASGTCDEEAKVLLERLVCASCPSVELSVHSGSACVGEKRMVGLTAMVSGAPANTYYQWSFSEGAPDEAAILVGNTAVTSHAFAPPGPHHATFRILSDGCLESTVDIPVLDPCSDECPSVGLTVQPKGCEAGERMVGLRVEVSGGSGEVALELDFGDGSPRLSYSTSAFSGSLGLDHRYAVPGPYTASLRVTQPFGCPDVVEKQVGPLDPCTVDPPEDPASVVAVEPDPNYSPTDAVDIGSADRPQSSPPRSTDRCRFQEMVWMTALLAGILTVFGGSCLVGKGDAATLIGLWLIGGGLMMFGGIAAFNYMIWWSYGCYDECRFLGDLAWVLIWADGFVGITGFTGWCEHGVAVFGVIAIIIGVIVTRQAQQGCKPVSLVSLPWNR